MKTPCIVLLEVLLAGWAGYATRSAPYSLAKRVEDEAALNPI